ncbi:MAG: group III truncated hemoglobin [Bacteroidota bacterium]
MKDITTKEDVTILVNTFYGKVLQDEKLKPFFANLDFEAHKPHMIHFWSFVLLDEPGYKTNVTEKHLRMPIKQEHFDRWLELFNETIDELFTGEKAEMAKQRAFTIAWTIGKKIGIN